MAAKKKQYHTEIISNDYLQEFAKEVIDSEKVDAPKPTPLIDEVLQIGEPNASLSFKRIKVLQI
jgi:hypothetical protein